jgi:hypothetical protein
MPTPATNDQVRPAIQQRGGQPRVPFYTGGIDEIGRKKFALRKPQQRKISDRSVWAVQFSGLAILVDPVDVNGTTVFNIAYWIN